MKADAASTSRGKRPTSSYVRPERIRTATLQEVLHRFGRSANNTGQADLLRSYGQRDTFLYYAGDLNLLAKVTVSIVGTRQISPAGIRRAAKLSRQLAEADVLVMSGLAKGVDTVAHTSALEARGHTAAVVGTPLDRVYPAENAELQMEIYSRHLLISPFNIGEQVYKSNFPARNKVMAVLSDATVIVEASDTSGTLHQAAECQRNNRWLFIMRSVVEDEAVTWPSKFLKHPKTRVLTDTSELLEAISR
ncbi:DNA-processing protein DprA [Rhizobium phaseoli]|uniref:DNA-processing protein DprA n=1 Tax=Rhizobium phaseoli TaxID=396 RepID=UPI0007F0819F|nr:DNA-processing protein DprA [Rhizobium phaseoli]ANL39537.1 DNA recombination-mediator protein [Rhizobium phaseoli]ANL58526.1 DNA recombination-mediator protein [Rhizobium phaseoli]